LQHLPAPAQIQLGGLLGQALTASRHGHLATFIQNETSPPIALFCPEHVCGNHEGDWYGEHAGKWLYTAARAANRTADPALAANVRRVADYLVSRQEPDGYLGTYAPERRFMQRVAPGPRTWDGAPGKRTWDIWVHSYLVLGLLEVHRFFPNERYLAAARRIGDLCWRSLTDSGLDVTSLGNHHGLSASVLLDPAVELYFATREMRYLDLAELGLRQANQHPSLELLTQALAGTDASAIATGKSYQISWNLVGLVKLHRATGNRDYLTAVQNVWTSIRQHHLSLGGGPWGGVAHRSREVFNPAGVFSPHGYVETCSTLSWIQLNRELFQLTGEARYIDEIEKSAYNDLLGAQAPNGIDWCYYSFPNGKRVYTTYWRCCKSSGPLALEELSPLAYSLTKTGDIAVNLYGPSKATLVTPGAGTIGLEQITRYPFDGHIQITLRLEQPADFAVALRIPAWAEEATIEINGERVTTQAAPNTFLPLRRTWRNGDAVTVQFPFRPRWHEQSNRNIQESRAPDGSMVQQEVLRFDYAAITRGPLVYATGLIDGFKTAETLRLPADRNQVTWEELDAPPGSAGPALRLNLGYRPALTFLPYFEAGGRQDHTWRLTWMHIAPS
ncbi:MAG: beta-L-arabinofuranosidase domain-containing protein, partial [Opitutae bacterium]